MKNEPKLIGRRPTAVRYAYRGHETGALAIGDQFVTALDERSRHSCLAERGLYRSQGQTTGQRGATFKESPSIRPFRTHGSLLRR